MSPNARLTLQVTQTQAPSIAANAITLGGTLTLAPQGNPLRLRGDAFRLQGRVRLGHADPRRLRHDQRVGLLFGVTLTPDADDAERARCDLGLEPNGPRGERAGLDAKLAARPRRAARAHRRRARPPRRERRRARRGERECAEGVAGFSFGNANVWARGADQFGTATLRLRAQASVTTSTAPRPSSPASIGASTTASSRVSRRLTWRPRRSSRTARAPM